MANSWIKYFRNKELIVNLQLVYYRDLSKHGCYYAATMEGHSHKAKAFNWTHIALRHRDLREY